MARFPTHDSHFPPPPAFRRPQFGDAIHHGERTYRIGPAIGKGHFGEVYACTDDWDSALVAKVLLPKNQAYAQVRSRWLDESNKLKALRHPNITYIHDAFECNGAFYLILERCSYDLTHLIADDEAGGQGWLPHVAAGVLRGLDYIHNEGFVHKDLHPGNIFISWQFDDIEHNDAYVFQAKIGDLGISRLETDIRIFGTVLAQWMLPPEAIRPDVFGTVGRQTDVYHAALCFLALILQQHPEFTRDQILDGTPRTIAESLNSPYAGALGRALRRRTEFRTATALQFWHDISSSIP